MATILSFIIAVIIVFSAATLMNFVFQVEYFYNTIFFVLMVLAVYELVRRVVKKKLE